MRRIFGCLIYVILGLRQCWFLSPNFYSTKLNVAQNNETNLTKQLERDAVLSSLRRRHAATKTTTTKMITVVWTNDTLQARALPAVPAVPASTDRKPVIQKEREKRKTQMTWELKYEFGWPAFHGHRSSIFAHSLAVWLWSALRNREWTESEKSGWQWTASTGSDVGLGPGKATADAVRGGREMYSCKLQLTVVFLSKLFTILLPRNFTTADGVSHVLLPTRKLCSKVA